MATKTISLELDADEKLKDAKRGTRESFSSVVRRAEWNDRPPTAGRLLENLRELAKDHPDTLLRAKALHGLDRRTRTTRRRTSW